MSDYLDPNNEELLKDFFAEAEQQVEQLESNILVIENDPTNHEAIDEIFRAAHTLKGGSATVEMTELSTFTHSVEDVLDEIRSDRVTVDEDVVDLLLTSIDVIKAMLEERQNGGVYGEDTTAILNKLHSYIPAKGSAPAAAKPKAPVSVASSAVRTPVQPVAAPAAPVVEGLPLPPLAEEDYRDMVTDLESGQKLWCVAVQFDETNPMNSVGGIQVFASLKNAGNVLKTVPDFDALYEDQFYEYVYYYIATSQDGAALEDASFLSDVTLVTDAKLITEDTFAGTPVPAAPVAPVVQAPVSTPAASPAPVSAPVQDVETPAAVQTPAPAAPVKVAAEKKEEAPAEKKAAGSGSASQGSILRVDSRRIDYLLNLVSETVITKASFNQLANQLANEVLVFQSLENSYKERIHKLFDQLPAYFEKIQKGTPISEVRKAVLAEYGGMVNLFENYDVDLKAESTKFRSYTQNLGRIAGELQEGVMKIRMVPISQIFSRFPRVVRDLQRDLNKKINLKIEGEDTELDKS
ncbi:MAG: Hpt domain-containing protein, partial [Treponema sp.]|nr:Hpt domain-containing protein [Treponema sp.]